MIPLLTAIRMLLGLMPLELHPSCAGFRDDDAVSICHRYECSKTKNVHFVYEKYSWIKYQKIILNMARHCISLVDNQIHNGARV